MRRLVVGRVPRERICGVPPFLLRAITLEVFRDLFGCPALLVVKRERLHSPLLSAGLDGPAGEFDKTERLVCGGFIGGGVWLRWGGRAGALELIQFAAGFVTLPAETDGTAAQAEFVVQRQVGCGGLTERFQGVESEADDVGGEMQFLLGFRFVGGEHLAGGLTGGGTVVVGGGQEMTGEVAEDRIENGWGDGAGKRHGFLGGVAAVVVHRLFDLDNR